jgi:hypothetical protein
MRILLFFANGTIILLAGLVTACSGGSTSTSDSPAAVDPAVAKFLDAVRAGMSRP